MKVKALFIAVIILTVTAIQTSLVQADVPTVLSITRRSEGGNLFVDVKVRHANPSTTHYIDNTRIDSDGNVKEYGGLQRATTTEYTFTLNLGVVTPKLIKAQAVCNLHGPSAYLQETSTGSGGIPAYSTEALIIGTVASMIIYSFFRRGRTPNF
jgi:desulfoferrodoxin (superoxide reductase-like protein)